MEGNGNVGNYGIELGFGCREFGVWRFGAIDWNRILFVASEIGEGCFWYFTDF